MNHVSIVRKTDGDLEGFTIEDGSVLVGNRDEIGKRCTFGLVRWPTASREGDRELCFHVAGLGLAIATTTSHQNIDALCQCCWSKPPLEVFDVIAAGDEVKKKSKIGKEIENILDDSSLDSPLGNRRNNASLSAESLKPPEVKM